MSCSSLMTKYKKQYESLRGLKFLKPLFRDGNYGNSTRTRFLNVFFLIETKFNKTPGDERNML